MSKIAAKTAGLLIVVVFLGMAVVAVQASGWQWFDSLKQQLKGVTSIFSEPSSSSQPETENAAQNTSPDSQENDQNDAEKRVINNYYTTDEVINNYTVVNDLNLKQLRPQSLLYINQEASIAILENGSQGKYLRSTGADTLPEWVSLDLSDDDDDDSFDASDITQLSLGGVDVPLKVGTGNPFQVLNSGRVELSYIGDSGHLSSSGGAIFINNTQNTGTALGIFSDAGSAALGNMINVKVDNPEYNQAAFYMNYDGLSNAVEIVSNSVDSSANALAVTNNNFNDSALGIIGYELAKGTIKVSHYRPGTGIDSSASGLSIDLKGTGTRAQGVYVDSTAEGGTLGNLLRLRNETIDKFVVNYQGNVFMAGSQTIGAVGTDTTVTKYGNVAGDEFFVGANASFRIQRAASNSEAFRTQILGDTNGRWVGTSDGRLRWGDGANPSDVTLRRGSSGILWLEGGMTFNNNSGDFDTIVKGSTESNLLFVDAGANAIGIGTSSPVARLQIVGGDVLLDNASAVRIKDSSGLARPVLSYTSGNNVQLYNYATGGMLQIGINNVNNTAGNIRFFTNNNVERMRIDPAGVGIGATSFGNNSVNILAIANSVAPTSSITDGIQLFAIDQAGSHELRVRDEAGNMTTLSPHNFTSVPEGPSEELAWAFFSERDGKSISADMTKALRIVEQLSGEQLVYLRDTQTGEYLPASAFKTLDSKKMTWMMELEDTYLDGTLEKIKAAFVSREELAILVEWGEAGMKFVKEVQFMAHSTFRSTVAFLGDVTFLGSLTVSQDTAGSVTIPAGVTEIQVLFDRPYKQVPLVYLTPTSQSRPGYSVSQVTSIGFIIKLDQAFPEATSFNWLALLTKEQATNTKVLTTSPISSPSPSASPEELGNTSEETLDKELESEEKPDIELKSSPNPEAQPKSSPSPEILATDATESVVLGETTESDISDSFEQESE